MIQRRLRGQSRPAWSPASGNPSPWPPPATHGFTCCATQPITRHGLHARKSCAFDQTHAERPHSEMLATKAGVRKARCRCMSDVHVELAGGAAGWLYLFRRLNCGSCWRAGLKAGGLERRPVAGGRGSGGRASRAALNACAGAQAQRAARLALDHRHLYRQMHYICEFFYSYEKRRSAPLGMSWSGAPVPRLVDHSTRARSPASAP